MLPRGGRTVVFRRVLIANRGEIALRVIRACRELGVESVVAHSEADRGGPWLERAHATVCIGPAKADRSYLDESAILQAAEQTECQAVHPGYGFLAENARFAARCEQQGLTFIGPGAGAIRRMGDKAEAKRTMAEAGLPTIPGSDGVLADADAAVGLADAIGYPVLLKAVSGGGGRGMRRCEDAGELRRLFAEATLEADKAFGDPRLYLEKLIEGGRHIEFQILCDAYGNGVHFGERECSIQRKHQKLIEESPSPALDAARRATMGERVAQAAAGFGYRNAGTVEFLLTRGGELYFMEMNTRLQVEHPVTEMVCGVDLVAMQLRVAALEPLDLRQDAIALRGHAVELRINAENPDDGFRPDPGTIESFQAPPERVDGARIRWDSAIRGGYRLPAHYDSMLGKLIAWGEDRAAAIDGALAALGALRIDGIHTTRDLHRRILEDPGFRSGSYDVDTLATSGLLAGELG
jgi:acetyl-CoA carboxylase biotin carboxylase subunit